MKFPFKEIVIFLILALIIFIGFSIFWEILTIRNNI